MRLGLRYVAGLRAEAAARIVAARTRAPFAERGRPRGARGAAPRTSSTRWPSSARSPRIDPAAGRGAPALWQVAALERDPRSLFAGAPPPAGAFAAAEMTPLEETLADYRASGITHRART